jgi:hypothetical protein
MQWLPIGHRYNSENITQYRYKSKCALLLNGIRAIGYQDRKEGGVQYYDWNHKKLGLGALCRVQHSR